MSFNDYMNDLNNDEKFQGYETLESFYFTHNALLREFVGIDNQFKMWLDKNTYNAKAISHLLPELANLISNLSEIRFEITELDNYEDNITLSKLIRYIKNVMTFSEVQINNEKLKNNIENHWKLKNEEYKNTETFNSFTKEINKEIELNSKIFNFFKGIKKQISEIIVKDSNINYITNFNSQLPSLIVKLTNFKETILNNIYYDFLSPNTQEFLTYINEDMILAELDNSIQKWNTISNDYKYFEENYWTPLVNNFHFKSSKILEQIEAIKRQGVKSMIENLSLLKTSISFNEKIKDIQAKCTQEEEWWFPQINRFNHNIDVKLNEIQKEINYLREERSRAVGREKNIVNEMLGLTYEQKSQKVKKVEEYYKNIQHIKICGHSFLGFLQTLYLPISEEQIIKIENHISNQSQRIYNELNQKY